MNSLWAPLPRHPREGGILKVFKKLDFRLRGNDVKVLLHWLRQLESTALPGFQGRERGRQRGFFP